MPKIALFALNSSYSHTNLAVRCIADSLRSHGAGEVEIHEFNLKDRRRRILEALFNAAADIYGFSAYIWNVRELCEFAADLKKLRPKALIVFGGPEVSYDSEEILAAHPFIDCIITGEGERAFVDLVRRFTDGEEIPRVVDGGIYADFESQGMVYETSFASSRVVYYESARGCPYRCAYCLSALSGKVRAKSADVTLSELREFERMDGIKIIKFVDRTFNFDRERAKQIWRGLLSEEYTKNYHFEICAELLDEETFSLLEKFPKGKIQLEIGVQSTNPATLADIHRSPRTEILLAAIKRLYDMGNMHIHADLIAGLPREDLASFARSFDALWGECDMLQLGFLKLLRGSELRRRADEFGCVYSDTPPYEVLATDCLSFSELCRLHEIDALLDRYVNSGAFSRAAALIGRRAESPFWMLYRLAERFHDEGLRITDIAQPRAYELLYEFMHDEDDTALAEALILDFLTHQKQSPPKLGSVEFKRVEDDVKRRFMRFADEIKLSYFAPCLEIRAGSGKKYVVDRHNLHVYTEHGDRFVEI